MLDCKSCDSIDFAGLLQRGRLGALTFWQIFRDILISQCVANRTVRMGNGPDHLEGPGGNFNIGSG